MYTVDAWVKLDTSMTTYILYHLALLDMAVLVIAVIV